MSEMNHLPRIAITMGDAAGIGPEVVVRACLEPRVRACCRPLVVGHAEVLRREVRSLGAPLEVREIRSADEADFPAAAGGGSDGRPTLTCLTCCDDAVMEVPPGRIDARAGRAAYDALCTAAELALGGTVDAIVTAPLCKAALHLAGLNYPGHTEILAERCRTDQFAMMLYLPSALRVGGSGGLGVVHATLHVSLRDAVAQLTSERILDCCRLAHEGMQRLAPGRPRIGVCALNPHAGEDGLFGTEESELIAPAIANARAEGLDVSGPLPADTLFVKARRGEFDAVVAMYHDQGHIALKLLGMHEAVNVTLGLPIVRTSPAHGTAMDIVGRQQAECSGMIAAIETAARLATERQLALSRLATASAVTSSHATSRGGEYSNERLSIGPSRLTSEN